MAPHGVGFLAILLGLTIVPVRANIYFDNSAGTLDFGTPANWSTDQLPSTPGVGSAFMGGNFDVAFSGTLTTVGELQVGTDANPYGTVVAPGGRASLTLNPGASLSVNSNMIVGQGQGTGGVANGGVVTINNGAALTIQGSNRRLYLGFYTNSTGVSEGTVNINGGTLTMASGLVVVGGRDNNEATNYGKGNLGITGGTVNLQSLGIGWDGGIGHVTQSAGTLTVGGYMSLGLGYNGRHGYGTYDMTGGTLNATGDFSVHESSDNASFASTFNQSGGTVNLGGSQRIVGRASVGTGTYNLNGTGRLNSAATGDLVIGGVNTGSSGVLNISAAASLNQGGIYALALGRTAGSSGTVNQTGGTVTLDPSSTLGVWLGGGGDFATSVYNLGGGTLVTPNIFPDPGLGSKSFNFDGGKLVANHAMTIASAPNFSTTIQSGGATIDTGTYAVTWNPPLLAGTGNGGLTKLGTGSLTLGGSNSYTGDTNVLEGTLAVSRAGFSDDSTVRIGSSGGATAMLALNFPGEDVVGKLVIDGVTMPPGNYDAASNPSRISGFGSIRIVSPFSSWAAAHGLDGTPGHENGFIDDPDSDGMANGLEWILGGDPTVCEVPGHRPTITVGADSIVYRFKRLAESVPVSSITVQWSPDLVEWNDIPILAGGTPAGPDGISVTTTADGNSDDIEVTIPKAIAGDGKLFARLRASAPGTGGTSPSEPVTMQSLLTEMTDYSAVARWPFPEYRCLQASSYDRATVSPDQPGWFANNDYTQYIRTEVNEGRQERVMMDDDGPGCIVRFWLTTVQNKSGTLRVYLDGATTPALSFPAYDLMTGTLNLQQPMILPHPGYTPDSNGGNTLSLPIPFASHCKVTWEEQGSGPRFYQIDYRKYAPSAKVESFTAQRLEAARGAIQQAATALLSPPSPTGTTFAMNGSIAPGGQSTLDLPPGPSAIRQIQLQLTPQASVDPAVVLRSMIVRIQFDGEETVWCPAGDFFGSGTGLNELHNWYRTVTPDGTMTCRWVMPYSTGARITLVNAGTSAVGASLSGITSPWVWNDRSMHFHTSWHYESGLTTPPARDWNFVDIGGKGVYVGDTLSIYNEIATWYGEGDEKIRVDSEPLPSFLGTGTEDYYNYSFAPQGIMQTPFASNTRVDQPMTQGNNVMTRSRNLDGIPFKHSLEFDFELISWQPTREIYAATTHWYALPGGTTNIAPDFAGATAYIPTLADAQQPPAAFAGAIDAELITPQSASPGLVYETQNMLSFGVGVWSRAAQLLVRGTQVGHYVVLNIPAPDALARKLYVSATRAPDFGILAFTVNGQAALSNFDGYNTSVTNSGKFLLGTFAPVNGQYQILVQVAGTNPASTRARYYFGLDYFTLDSP